MRKLSMEDLFKVLAKPLPDFEIKPKKTALLLIDMQEIISSEVLLQEALDARLPEKEVKETLKNMTKESRRL